MARPQDEDFRAPLPHARRPQACPRLDPGGAPRNPSRRREPTREILFLDPGVSDIETLLGHLRPEVEPILLDPVRPAARQIAAAVAGERDLDAVHVIAHGAPGRVSFTAGDWSAATLEEAAEDLAAIGQASAPAAISPMELPDCRRSRGCGLFAGLARASGADIAAATGLVGAAALGGGWELTAAAQPPLTAAGVAAYAGVLGTATWSGGASATWYSATWSGGSGSGRRSRRRQYRDHKPRLEAARPQR